MPAPRLADNRHPGRPPAVGKREVPAPQNRNAHCAQVIGPDIRKRRALALAAHRRRSFHLIIRVLGEHAHRGCRIEAREFHAGQHRNASQQLLPKRVHASACVIPARGKLEAHRQNVVRMKAQVDAGSAPEALHQQTRPGKQDQPQRDLSRHQNFAGSLASRTNRNAQASRLSCSGWILPPSLRRAARRASEALIPASTFLWTAISRWQSISARRSPSNRRRRVWNSNLRQSSASALIRKFSGQTVQSPAQLP